MEICRQLWIWLAEAQMELGLKQITVEMIDELMLQKKNINKEKLHLAEKRLKHDVMANIEIYSEVFFRSY